MKNWGFYSIFICILFFSIFYSCSKEEDNSNSDQKTNAEMTANIDGVEWSATTPVCIIHDSVASLRTNCTDKENITITFYRFEEGIYHLDASERDFAILNKENSTYITLSGMHSLNTLEIFSIHAEDSKISGSFEFLARNVLNGETVEVANGRFQDIPYIYVSSPAFSNELQVDINGENHFASEVESIIYLNKFYIISTIDDAGSKVSLSFPADIDPGHYNLAYTGMTGKIEYNEGRTLVSESGSLEIIKHDKKNDLLTGYFKFEARDTISGSTASLTNGRFYLLY